MSQISYVILDGNFIRAGELVHYTDKSRAIDKAKAKALEHVGKEYYVAALDSKYKAEVTTTVKESPLGRLADPRDGGRNPT